MNSPKFKPLTFSKKSLSGRGNSGSIILKTKGRLHASLRYPVLNYKPRFRYISIIGSFTLISFQNKLAALCFLASGALTYLPSTAKFALFDIIKPTIGFTTSYSEFFRTSIMVLLTVPILSKVSLIELYPGLGAQYARSSGTFAKFIKIN